jgi:two-component system sensor histidine kinase NreB
MMYSLEMCKRLEGEQKIQLILDLQAQVSYLMDQARELSLKLRPNTLDDLGLFPALEWSLRRYQAQTGILVHYDSLEPDFSLRPDVETAVFRVVQEALTNTARYARVKEVSVTVKRRDETLWVTIEDHGAGFDLTVLETPELSLGVSGMHERTTLVGGHFEIDSAPGQGARICAKFPIDQPIERRRHDR